MKVQVLHWPQGSPRAIDPHLKQKTQGKKASSL